MALNRSSQWLCLCAVFAYVSPCVSASVVIDATVPVVKRAMFTGHCGESGAWPWFCRRAVSPSLARSALSGSCLRALRGAE
jgi:hypothetical protein